MKNSKFSYLVQNTVLFTIGTLGSKILAFLLVPFYTNILSTAEYGTIDLVSTTSTLLIFVFTLNIAESVLRFAIDKKTDPESILAFGIRVTVIGMLILTGCTFLVWKSGFINWQGYLYVFLLLQFFTAAMHQMLTSYLRAVDKIKQVAVSGILNTLIMIISNLLLLLVFKCGIIGYLASIVIGNTVSCLYDLAVIGKINIFAGLNKSTKIEMLAYSVPLIFNGVAWWINSSIDKYFLAILCGISLNGIYSVAQKIPTILSTFQSVFAQAWNLSAIKEFDKNDSDGFFGKTYRTYNAMMVLGSSLLIIFNVLISKLLFAKDFFAAWRYSSILILSLIFSALSSFLGSIFSAVKISRILAVSTITASILNIVLNIWLVPEFGAAGAAVATLCSFICVWAIRLSCAGKYINWEIGLGKSIFSYVLLIIQVVIEHSESHFYLGQILILFILLLLYRHELKWIIAAANNKISGIINYRNKV